MYDDSYSQFSFHKIVPSIFYLPCVSCRFLNNELGVVGSNLISMKDQSGICCTHCDVCSSLSWHFNRGPFSYNISSLPMPFGQIESYLIYINELMRSLIGLQLYKSLKQNDCKFMSPYTVT